LRTSVGELGEELAGAADEHDDQADLETGAPIGNSGD